MLLIDRIKNIPIGTKIPKPQSTKDFLLQEIGEKDGEPAVAYTIPLSSGRQGTKWLTRSQLEAAYEEICGKGEITKAWWREHIALGKDDGGCNFTTFGGLLVLLGEAERAGSGRYRRMKS
ncbi:MAG: hypothetical protein L0215_00225 [Gemmataceae bacterium]|nr:hypothetical protein [Gemmataceae bacterium]